jgi:hypothetical protein
VPTVIERQIDAFRESVAEQERRSEPADVAGLVAVGLMMYDALQGLCHRFDREIAAGERRYELTAARAAWQEFVDLHELLRTVSRIASRAHREGQRFDGLDRLEQAVIECGLIASVPPDRADAAEGRNGPRKTMAEVRDELRRRMGA